ncbi:MAG: hypothetical protein ACRDH2_18265, partial [Anaerolineales bacterium]
MEKFGRDEWVAQVAGRRAAPTGWQAQVLARWNAVPVLWRMLALLALAASIPLVTSNDYFIRIAGNVCLFAALALGLNVVVGYA